MVHNSIYISAELDGAHVTTDAGRNSAAGTIHWNNGDSQEIFWDNHIAK